MIAALALWLAGSAQAGIAPEVELAVGGAVAGGILLGHVDLALDGGAEFAALGAGLGGVGGSIAAVTLDPSEADAMLITTGLGLGVWTGTAIAQYAAPTNRYTGYPGGPTRPLLGPTLGMLGGTAAGLGAAALLEIEPGQAALVRTGMLWGTWYADLTHAWWPTPWGRPAHDRALLGTFVGGALGAGAAAMVRPERWQVAAASAVGWGGVVAVYLAQLNHDDRRAGVNAAMYAVVPPVLAAASVPLLLLGEGGSADVQVAATPGGLRLSGRW